MTASPPRAQPGPPWRGARALAFAVVALWTGALGHAATAGTLPALPGLLGCLAVLAGLGYALAGRERGAGTILAGLVLAQGVVHLAASSGGGHVHGAGAGLPAQGGAMLVAHLLGCAVTAWWLARGEAFAWRGLVRLAGALGRRARRRGHGGRPPATPLPVADGHLHVPLAPLASGLSRRGPPLRAAATAA